MDQSGIVGFTVTGIPEKITDFRTASCCTQMVFAQMLGLDEISEDVVCGLRGSRTVPSVKIGRRLVINLHRIRRDLEQGKSIFSQGGYKDE